MAKITVSVWAGCFDSEDALQTYTEPVYSDDGDITAPFLTDFGIDQDDFDDDFFECTKTGMQTDSLAVLLNGCSYGETLIPALQIVCSDALPFPCNAAILMYGYCYDGSVAEKNGIRFIGCAPAETDR